MISRFLLVVFCCGLFIVILILSLSDPAIAQEVSDKSPRFGVIESYESPGQADRLGVGWTRIPFNWSEVQAAGPGTWQPRISDEVIQSEIDAGRLPVGLLIGVPDWARDENLLPIGLWLSHDDPENTWANYVREAVGRYQGRIDHWIIWNEPDIGAEEIAHTWDGSVADFAQLQRIAYLAAKETQPNVQIHLGAFTYWADYYAGTEQYMARLLDEIKQDPLASNHNYYFDIATAHLYFQPNQVYDLLTLFTSIMRERGMDQPIWLVETNAPPKDDPAWLVPNWTLSVTQNEQAAYIPQAMAAAMAAGAERIAVYKLKDTEEDRSANPEPFGLVRLDGSERPAFASYRIAIDYMSETFWAERERWNEVGQIRLDQPGRTTSVLFARLPQGQQAQVIATDSLALLVDMWGTKTTISPTNGLYTVDLPPARCSQSIGDYCMIGGPLYYLVQAADVLPPTNTPTHTPTSTDTPAATPTIILTITPEPTTTPEPQFIDSPEPSRTPIANPPSIRPATPVAEASEPGSLSSWLIPGAFLTLLLVGIIVLVIKSRS